MRWWGKAGGARIAALPQPYRDSGYQSVSNALRRLAVEEADQPVLFLGPSAWYRPSAMPTDQILDWLARSCAAVIGIE